MNLKILFLLFILTLVSSLSLELEYFSFFSGFENLITFLWDSYPPDTSILKVSVISILETLQIAFLGTLFGSVLALPLSMLAARNLFPAFINIPVKIFSAFVRTMPALLWAIIFVIMVGLGPLAGVLATSMYTLGYLSKMFFESIEGVDPESTLAIKGMGANKIQIIQYVILPEAANNLISQILFVFEYNVRGSTILGFVGAGGVGFYISNYLKLLQYDKIATILILVFLTVILIEFLSSKIRAKYLIK